MAPSANEVDAINEQSGKSIWTFHDEHAKQDSFNRGMAILGNAVYYLFRPGKTVRFDCGGIGCVYIRLFESAQAATGP